MELKQVVSKQDYEPLTVEEMILVVENYIKDKKGISVSINIKEDYGNSAINAMMYKQQCVKLMNAYNVAKSYYV